MEPTALNTEAPSFLRRPLAVRGIPILRDIRDLKAILLASYAGFRLQPSPLPDEAGFGCSARWKDKQDGQKTSRQMPQVSACGSHKSIPQSEHCVLAYFPALLAFRESLQRC